MFGWFRPTCPCDLAAKKWVEDRLRWLSDYFGLHVLLERSVILPTEEFFPDPYDGSPKAVQRMFERVCDYMGVDSDNVQLELSNEKVNIITSSVAAGTWSEGDWLKKSKIKVDASNSDRPADLVGVMAHELAHQRLLGEKRCPRDNFDNELLTDLTAVFHGFGVFLANNPKKSTGQLFRWPGTNLYRPEYLSEPMLGYAMAHIAWMRDERHPLWAKHLRWAQRSVFKQGLRFLNETGDSSFRPARLGN